jgi:hypothetical protein
MHTIMVLASALGLLGVCALAGRVLGGTSGAAAGAVVFVPIWFVAAGINMYIGVTRAGYSVAEETPVFLVVFGIPAVAALLVWRKLR